jgi:hypothetical protein
VRRPTTGVTHACVWAAAEPADDPAGGSDRPAAEAGPLLDWLGVERRFTRSDGGLAGLVLLDLPDFDSVEAAHRVEADRLLSIVDLFIWVLDPQKYADKVVHSRYLAPLRHHRDVTVVLLTQVDLVGHGSSPRTRRRTAVGTMPNAVASRTTSCPIGPNPSTVTGRPARSDQRCQSQRWSCWACNIDGRWRLSASRYIITVEAIGVALDPDEVVIATPRSTIIWNTGWSTPADIVCSQLRFEAPRATLMKAGARSGQASLEKNARVIRSMSSADTGSVPLSVTICSVGAIAVSRSPCVAWK